MFLLREEARTLIRDWEIQTRGAIQFNFTNYNAGEGIRLRRTDLPGDVLGFSGLLLPPTNIGVVVAQAPRQSHSLRIPQAISNRIRNCDVFLDPTLWNVDPAVLWHVIKHEVGHCLGFVDHTWESDSVMSQSVCCPMKIIPRVAAMMRELYTLPIGTEVH
ncbi:MAG: hypothetical protein HY002_06740 [Candidatus Rokubacteria bacterium]|nr:hypothetical protein [Candidatus Rokubacteria bacterium]